jgi:hypothetical protein
MLKSVIAGVIVFLMCFYGNGSLGFSLSLLLGLSPFAVTLIHAYDLEDLKDWDEEAFIFLCGSGVLVFLGLLYGSIVFASTYFISGLILRVTGVSEDGTYFVFIALCLSSLIGVTQGLRYLTRTR